MMAEWDQQGQQGDQPEMESQAAASWLQVLLGVLCAVGFVALLFGLVYIKANGL
ncbi:hypothetical protein [Sphaerobacter thermophilus]|jgi:hypothetical protein|uniref:hypothetical protein n=2 Tax=Sphaerobacter thermophilus TaxID=2057 RepID=UPI0039765445